MRKCGDCEKLKVPAAGDEDSRDYGVVGVLGVESIGVPAGVVAHAPVASQVPFAPDAALQCVPIAWVDIEPFVVPLWVGLSGIVVGWLCIGVVPGVDVSGVVLVGAVPLVEPPG